MFKKLIETLSAAARFALVCSMMIYLTIKYCFDKQFRLEYAADFDGVRD